MPPMTAEQLIKVLKAIRHEARKGKQDPDKIFFMADDAIRSSESTQ